MWQTMYQNYAQMSLFILKTFIHGTHDIYHSKSSNKDSDIRHDVLVYFIFNPFIFFSVL